MRLRPDGYRLHYYHRLGVLHTAKQPADLMEAGFIVNRKSEQMRAMQEKLREHFSQAIAEGMPPCLPGRMQAHRISAP